MRYNLRNQNKISDYYSDKTLIRIKNSLDEYFKTATNIDSKLITGDKYETLYINDIGHSCGLIGFFIIGKIFDVYRLAFKEFIS